MKYRIRELREAKMIAQPPRPMTLGELAAATGLSIGLLSDIERGQQTTTRTLERMAHALGVRVTDLLTDERAHGNGLPNSRSAKTGRSGAGKRGKEEPTTAAGRGVSSWEACHDPGPDPSK